MKIILSSRIHHYVKRFGIFLITAALVMGLAAVMVIIPLFPKTWKYGIGMIWMPSETTWTVTTL